jgi:hypothetical protein
VLGTALLLFGLLAVLGRFRGGVLLRPIVERLSKIGFMRRFFEKASTAAMERQNPELAAAIKKMQMAGPNPNQQAAQKAMSRLTPAERRAYLDAVQEQGLAPEATNRQARRQMERLRQQTGPSSTGPRSGGGGGSSRAGAPKRKRKR